ncbi:MAG: hypothetical protein HUU35_07545 [Armatimonadetes bacterium]|nr:hypothetical protein [Armatimonadota bacterium]
MTSRERVLAAMARQPVDRLPQFESFWGEFVTAWRAARQPEPGVDITAYYGIDLAICAADETPFFTGQEVLERGDGETLRRDGWGRVLRERSSAWFYEVVSNVAGSPEALLAMPFDDPTDDARYDSYLRQVAAAEARGQAAFCKIGGPFLRTTFVRGEADYLMDIAGDPGYARELADRMADHLLAIGTESLRRGGLTGTGIWMYDDVAYNNGPFISLKSFEQIFLPGYERIVRGCKEAGARYFVFHSDGDIRPLLPYLAEIGVDAINPVEPRAGMNVVDLARQYRDRLVFIGGVDNAEILPHGTVAEVEAHVAPIARAAREEGGIILGTHSIGPDVPLENYEAYWETVRRH